MGTQDSVATIYDKKKAKIKTAFYKMPKKTWTTSCLLSYYSDTLSDGDGLIMILIKNTYVCICIL